MGSTQTGAMNAATAEANLAASSVGAQTAAVTESPVAEDVQTGTAAAAAPVSAPAVTDADARALFAANSETQASTFSEESASTVTHSTPRLAVSPPAPPALDALHAWWPDAAMRDFTVQYEIGRAACGGRVCKYR